MVQYCIHFGGRILEYLYHLIIVLMAVLEFYGFNEGIMIYIGTIREGQINQGLL